MMFLLRATFWLGLVLVLLPSGGTKSETQSQVSAAEAVSAASAAVSDMSQFCTRQPTACQVGSQAAVTIGQRAQAGAKMLFDFFAEHATGSGPSGTGGGAATADNGTTGSIESIPASQDTLRPTDVAPAWRGPRKDPRQPA